jgi:hypothetical protein
MFAPKEEKYQVCRQRGKFRQAAAYLQTSLERSKRTTNKLHCARNVEKDDRQ